jgi:hypothetical protein
MGSRYRRQEETRITLEGGDWLLVKRHLTAGDERGAYAKVLKGGSFSPGERPLVDPEHLGIAQVISYLLDWNITDADDKPIRVRDASYDFIASALNGMAPESLREIITAIQAHDAAMTAERDAEKKTATGSPVPDPTSLSVA